MLFLRIETETKFRTHKIILQMEKRITVKSEYKSLENILDFLKKDSPYEASIEYDAWDVRTDENGLMEKCIIIKKSAMHGLKLYFTKDNEINTSYLIPNKIMNAYFGESKKAHQSILEIATGAIKKTLLAGSQNQAFEEIVKEFSKIKA